MIPPLDIVDDRPAAMEAAERIVAGVGHGDDDLVVARAYLEQRGLPAEAPVSAPPDHQE